ncbi:hypothetical protein MMC09_000608 [Bachmanniomyces sp. S44760]|nr:hypothetical protein [Bachmanniomyces sp. S44760]
MYRYLWEREQPTTARLFFDFGLSLDVDREDDICNTAVRLLGHIALDMAQPKAALVAYNETLSARLKLVPSDDPAIADVYDSIACAHTETGDTTQAYKYLDKAIAIHEAKDPSRMARTDAILAMTHLRAGSADQALTAIKDCWRLQNKTEDQLEESRYPKHSGDIMLLSRIRYAQGDKSSALELASKAITIRKGMLGDKGPRVADSMYHVARILADEGKPTSAAKLLREIIEMGQGLIEMKGHLARALWNLANLEADSGGDPDDVLRLRSEACKTRACIEGRESEDVDTDEDFAKLVCFMLW